MAGQQDLTFNQLRKIADYFGRGVLFFLEPDPVDEARIHTPQFRTLANEKPQLSPEVKAIIERIEKQRSIYLSLRENLDYEEKPEFNAPTIPFNNPSDSARIARSWLNLSDNNTFESYRASVEVNGILVFRSNGYSGKWQIPKDNPILGFNIYDNTCPIIMVKKQNAEARQTFTLMHELGHLLLHRTSSIDDEQDLNSNKGNERDANAFAGHLLVPDVFLETINDVERPDEVSEYDDWIEAQRKMWGVSGEVILRRLLDVGRLPHASYTAYRNWRAEQTNSFHTSGSRKYRYREPKHVFGDTFVKTVFEALNARHITLAKASNYLDNLKIKDIHRLEDYYGNL